MRKTFFRSLDYKTVVYAETPADFAAIEQHNKSISGSRKLSDMDELVQVTRRIAVATAYSNAGTHPGNNGISQGDAVIYPAAHRFGLCGPECSCSFNIDGRVAGRK